MCALCVHTTNLPEDYCLLGSNSVCSVRHTYPPAGCIPQEDAVSIFKVALHHCPQKCQYTCTSLHAIISHKTVIFILTAFEGSKPHIQKTMSSTAVLNYLTTAANAVASKKNMIISNLQFVYCQ